MNVNVVQKDRGFESTLRAERWKEIGLLSLGFKNKEETTITSKYLNSLNNHSQTIVLEVIAGNYGQIDHIYLKVNNIEEDGQWLMW